MTDYPIVSPLDRSGCQPRFDSPGTVPVTCEMLGTCSEEAVLGGLSACAAKGGKYTKSVGIAAGRATALDNLKLNAEGVER